MRNINLITAGAICAILTTLSFVVGVAFSAGSGVQTIIPDTGKDAINWINDAASARAQGTGSVLAGRRAAARSRGSSCVCRSCGGRGSWMPHKMRPLTRCLEGCSTLRLHSSQRAISSR